MERRGLRVVLILLVGGCSTEIGAGLELVDPSVDPSVVDEGNDAGPDAGVCPEYKPDRGVIRLMRGCPLTIDYAIK
jgi:hypothetical protein